MGVDLIRVELVAIDLVKIDLVKGSRYWIVFSHLGRNGSSYLPNLAQMLMHIVSSQEGMVAFINVHCMKYL